MKTQRERAVTRSLEWKLPLLISGIVTVAVVTYCLAAYREQRIASVAYAQERLKVLSGDIAGSVSGGGGGLRLRGVGTRTIENAIVPGAKPDSVTDGFRHAMTLAIGGVVDSSLRQIDLWTPDLRRVVTVGDAQNAKDSAMLDPVLRGIIRSDSGNAMRRSALYVEDGHVVSWAIYPVVDNGHPVAFVAERRRQSNGVRVMQTLRDLTGQPVTYLVADSDGTVWTGASGEPIAAPFTIRSQTKAFVVDQPDGDKIFAQPARVANAPWTFLLTEKQSDVLRPAMAFLRRMLLIGLVLVIIGALAAWVLSRHVTLPLRAVIDASDAVAAGDYSARVSLTRGDELGLLSTRFNAMAERIGASHAELAQRVNESSALTETLQARNADLRRAQDDTLRAVGRTERLQAVTSALASAVDYDAVANVILHQGIDAVGGCAGLVYLANDDGSELTLLASHGYKKEQTLEWQTIDATERVPLTDALRTGEPAFVPSVDEWKTRNPRSRIRGATSGAWAALPLVARGHIIGVWGVSFTDPSEFNQETRTFIEALAQQCAQGLDRAGAFDSAVRARKSAEESQRSAQAANNAKSAFLAMMSHELRTPLNAIGGYTELLELGVRGDVTDAQRQDLARIRRNQQHLLSLINNILNLSRIEAGQLSISLADLPLEDVMAETEALIAPQVGMRGIGYDVDIESDGVAVRADREKLQQVLLNLISNAIRFTDAGGSIRISCRATSSRVYIAVADTGIGIAPEHLDSIFEPFVQLDSGLTRRNGGTGLGLAISRELMAAMAGRITVTSVPGKGSVFTVELPRAGVPSANQMTPRQSGQRVASSA